MAMSDTMTARQALAVELHHVGSLYAQQAQTLSGIAARMNQIPSSEAEELQMDATEARDRATYAALCANFMASAAHRIQTGDYDWEFLQMLSEFTDPLVVPDDMTMPSAS